MGPSVVVKIWVPYKAQVIQKLDSHDSWATTVNFRTYFPFPKKFLHGLDHLITYQHIQDFVDDDKWIYVLMMRSSSRLTQLQITASVRGRGMND